MAGNSTKKPGMPAGYKTKKVRVREEVEDLAISTFKDMMIGKTENVLIKVYEKTQEGDMTACKLWLDRVLPVTKAVDSDSSSGDLNIQINVQGLEREVKEIP
jgi:hypothetical protein